MSAAIVRRTETGFTVQIEIPDRASMLEAEDAILDGLNRAGVAATAEALPRFDADGKPMAIDGLEFTSNRRHAAVAAVAPARKTAAHRLHRRHAGARQADLRASLSTARSPGSRQRSRAPGLSDWPTGRRTIGSTSRR